MRIQIFYKTVLDRIKEKVESRQGGVKVIPNP